MLTNRIILIVALTLPLNVAINDANAEQTDPFRLGIGIEHRGTSVTITEVIKDTPAEWLGLQAGDRIVRVNTIHAFINDQHFLNALNLGAGEFNGFVMLEIVRGGQRYFCVPQLQKRQENSSGFALVPRSPFERYVMQCEAVTVTFEREAGKLPPKARSLHEACRVVSRMWEDYSKALKRVYTDDLPEDLRRDHSNLASALLMASYRFRMGFKDPHRGQAALAECEKSVHEALNKLVQTVMFYNNERLRNKRQNRDTRPQSTRR